MTTIAHISDLHLLDVEGTTPFHFANKRATGAVNLLLKRAHHHKREIVETALEQIADHGVDHLVVTGDLTNLSLEPEFRLAVQLMADFGANERVSVIPGNHDNYVYRSYWRRRFDHHFGPWQESDMPDLQADGPYPFVKLSEGYAIVGLSSSIATGPLMATGRVSPAQLDALTQILAAPELDQRIKIVIVHHPLGLEKVSRLHFLRRLRNAEALKRILLRGGADLVLHGHNHRAANVRLERPDGKPMWVVEAGSTSTIDRGSPKHSGKFNLYRIEDGQLASIERYAFNNMAGEFVHWRTESLAS